MPDNITLPGTGGIVATETVAGAQVQRVKPGWGALDTFAEIDTATPLPVVQTGTPALPVGAATAAKQDTAQTSLSTIGTLLAGTLEVQDDAAVTGLATLHTDTLATNTSLATVNTSVGVGNTTGAVINTAIGAQADVAATADTGSFSLIAYLKRGVAKLTALVTALAGGLPAALGATGGLKVEGIAGGIAQPISGTVISKQATDILSNAGVDLVPKFVAISASASGNNALVALVAGKRIRVLSYVAVAAAAVNAKFQSSTTSDLTGLMDFSANGGVVVPLSSVGLFQTVAGEALNINLSGAVLVGGHLTYVEV